MAERENIMREHSGQVVELLEAYSATKKKIDLLQYELERTKAVPSSEFMIAMTFGQRSMEDHRPTGDISDPTLRIAMNYESAAERLKSEAVKDIIFELEPLKETVERLEHYVSLLEKRQMILIKSIYFDGCSLDAAAEKIGIAPRTARTIKKNALEELTRMYEYVRRINKS